MPFHIRSVGQTIAVWIINREKDKGPVLCCAKTLSLTAEERRCHLCVLPIAGELKVGLSSRSAVNYVTFNGPPIAQRTLCQPDLPDGSVFWPCPLTPASHPNIPPPLGEPAEMAQSQIPGFIAARDFPAPRKSLAAYLEQL